MFFFSERSHCYRCYWTTLDENIHLQIQTLNIERAWHHPKEFDSSIIKNYFLVMPVKTKNCMNQHDDQSNLAVLFLYCNYILNFSILFFFNTPLRTVSKFFFDFKPSKVFVCSQSHFLHKNRDLAMYSLSLSIRRE